MKQYTKPSIKEIEMAVAHQLLAESDPESFTITKGTAGDYTGEGEKPGFWDTIW